MLLWKLLCKCWNKQECEKLWERHRRQKCGLARKAEVGEKWSKCWHCVQYSGHCSSSLTRPVLFYPLPGGDASRLVSLGVIILFPKQTGKLRQGEVKTNIFKTSQWILVALFACLKGNQPALSHDFHEPHDFHEEQNTVCSARIKWGPKYLIFSIWNEYMWNVGLIYATLAHTESHHHYCFLF